MDRTTRSLLRSVEATTTVEGEGARIKRSIGGPDVRRLDPFLLLDEFFVEPPAQFPMHGHSGFEIVTYVMDGAFEHTDSTGASGQVAAGGVQHIVAGAGIRHSEVPVGGKLGHGLQLWVALPPDKRAMEPGWNQAQPEDLPLHTTEGDVRVRTIVGGISPVKLQVPVEYFDVDMPTGGLFTHDTPPAQTAFVYVLEGQVEVGDDRRSGEAGQLLVLGKGDRLAVKAVAPSRMAVGVGQPVQ